MEYYFTYQTPIGKIVLVETGGAITELSFANDHKYRGTLKETPLLRTAGRQLSEFLAGSRREFDLPLCAKGTEFQRDVWDALLQIPFGETTSYAGIAADVGRPKSCRAVGNAVGSNPIPIIIPCHRVIATSGKIGGFSLGLGMKRKLLDIEGIVL